MPETLFISNVECVDATGAGIAKTVLHELAKKGIEAKKIMSLGSDGASAMTGKEKRAAAIMRRSNPHMHNVHCIAHRLALCTSQGADKIPMLKKHQQVLTDLFYYFKGSGKREARLHEIQKVLDDPRLTIKEIHAVRWLSYFNALTAVWRCLDSLFTYLADASKKDPKALGLKKKIATDTFIGTTYLMMDAMSPLTILSQFFQTKNIDIALVKVSLENCKDDLQKVCNLETPYLKQLKGDLIGVDFKGHRVTNSNFKLGNLVKMFIQNITENLDSRFPSNDLISSFGVLGLRPISLMSKTDVDKYGEKELEALSEYYGKPKVATWKSDDGVVQTTTAGPIISPEETLSEWKLLKRGCFGRTVP